MLNANRKSAKLKFGNLKMITPKVFADGVFRLMCNFASGIFASDPIRRT